MSDAKPMAADFGLPKATQLPRMASVRQRLQQARLHDVEGVVRLGLKKLGIEAEIGNGRRVGITAGSRGAGGSLDALKAVIAEVRSCGGEPSVIPAMGNT